VVRRAARTISASSPRLGAGQQLVLPVGIGDALRPAAGHRGAQRPRGASGPAGGVDHQASGQARPFNSAGGKAALLKLALDWAIVGDDEPVAMADRPAVKAIQAEPDPRKALMPWVQNVVEVAARIAPIGEVLAAAADVDPAAAELLAEANRNRPAGWRV